MAASLDELKYEVNMADDDKWRGKNWAQLVVYNQLVALELPDFHCVNVEPNKHSTVEERKQQGFTQGK